MNFTVFACDAALLAEFNRLVTYKSSVYDDDDDLSAAIAANLPNGTRLGGYTMLVFCMLFNMALLAIHFLRMCGLGSKVQ
jgi:hypothetical protein